MLRNLAAFWRDVLRYRAGLGPRPILYTPPRERAEADRNYHRLLSHIAHDLANQRIARFGWADLEEWEREFVYDQEADL